MSNEHSLLHQPPTWHTPTTEPMKNLPTSHLFNLEQMLSERQYPRQPPGVDLTLTRNGNQNGDVPTTPISLSVRDTNKINSLPVSALDIQAVELTKSVNSSSKTTSPGLKSSSPGMKSTSPGLKTTSPGLKSTSPGLKSASPGLKSTSPGLKSLSPGLKSTSPGLKSSSPGLKSTSPGLKSLSPGIKTTSPSLMITPSLMSPSSMSLPGVGLLSTNPNLIGVSAGLMSVNPSLMSANPSLISNPSLMTNSSLMSSNSSLKSTSPGLKSTSPGIKPMSPGLCTSPGLLDKAASPKTTKRSNIRVDSILERLNPALEVKAIQSLDLGGHSQRISLGDKISLEKKGSPEDKTSVDDKERKLSLEEKNSLEKSSLEKLYLEKISLEKNLLEKSFDKNIPLGKNPSGSSEKILIGVSEKNLLGSLEINSSGLLDKNPLATTEKNVGTAEKNSLGTMEKTSAKSPLSDLGIKLSEITEKNSLGTSSSTEKSSSALGKKIMTLEKNPPDKSTTDKCLAKVLEKVEKMAEKTNLEKTSGKSGLEKDAEITLDKNVRKLPQTKDSGKSKEKSQETTLGKFTFEKFDEQNISDKIAFDIDLEKDMHSPEKTTKENLGLDKSDETSLEKVSSSKLYVEKSSPEKESSGKTIPGETLSITEDNADKKVSQLEESSDKIQVEKSLNSAHLERNQEKINQDKLLQNSSAHDENSNSSTTPNIFNPTTIREEDNLSALSNEDSSDGNRSRRKRKPSRTVRVSKEEKIPEMMSVEMEIKPKFPKISVRSDLKSEVKSGLANPLSLLETDDQKRVEMNLGEILEDEKLIERQLTNSEEPLDDIIPTKTRRKASSEAETLADIAAMVQEGLEKKDIVNYIQNQKKSEVETKTESVVKMEDSAQNIKANVDLPKDLDFRKKELEEGKRIATSTDFVEVEDKLERMFAGIEETVTDPLRNEITEGQGEDFMDSTNDISLCELASTSQDLTPNSEKLEISKKNKKNKGKSSKSNSRRNSESNSAEDTPKKKKSGKKSKKVTPPSSVKSGKSSLSSKKGKNKNFKQVLSRMDAFKDVYAYDSGSNTSSTKSRGPFVQIKGSRDSPLSVNIVNAPCNEEDSEKKSSKVKKVTYFYFLSKSKKKEDISTLLFEISLLIFD